MVNNLKSNYMISLSLKCSDGHFQIVFYYHCIWTVGMYYRTSPSFKYHFRNQTFLSE